MRIRSWMKKDETGFTIVEAMMVMAIAAILAAIAIPAFSTWIPEYRLKRAVQDIYSNLQLAKMEAVRTNSTRSIVFDPGAGTYTTAGSATVKLSEEYGPGVKYGQGNASETVIEDTNFGDFVTYSDNKAEFNSRGMGNNSGYVYIENKKGTAYAVGSLISGVVVLRKWSGSEWK